MGNGAERKMVFLERKMEWGSDGRPLAIRGRLSSHCGPDAGGRRGQPPMGLARELARSIRSEVESVRELLSGRQLLRLGSAQCLWPAHPARCGCDGKLRLQDADGLPAFNEGCAGKTGRDRGVRLRTTPPQG